MISLTRFDGTKFYLNAELIQVIEGIPNTILTLTNSQKIVVKENPEIVVERIIAYQRIVRNPQLNVNIGE